MRHVNDLGPTQFRTGAEMTKSKSVTITATKRIGLLIVSCPLEYKHQQML